ncbi:hypothetical protein [Nakamurella flava]|uniref:hypothetical protein n=1 Tax=Nakamurella flava TaxID=2576308 RepID=UPI0014072738|nr:hypothetical protein [Nakamurella flava]
MTEIPWNPQVVCKHRQYHPVQDGKPVAPHACCVDQCCVELAKEHHRNSTVPRPTD